MRPVPGDPKVRPPPPLSPPVRLCGVRPPCSDRRSVPRLSHARAGANGDLHIANDRVWPGRLPSRWHTTGSFSPHRRGASALGAGWGAAVGATAGSGGSNTDDEALAAQRRGRGGGGHPRGDGEAVVWATPSTNAGHCPAGVGNSKHKRGTLPGRLPSSSAAWHPMGSCSPHCPGAGGPACCEAGERWSSTTKCKQGTLFNS